MHSRRDHVSNYGSIIAPIIFPFFFPLSFYPFFLLFPGSEATDRMMYVMHVILTFVLIFLLYLMLRSTQPVKTAGQKETHMDFIR